MFLQCSCRCTDRWFGSFLVCFLIRKGYAYARTVLGESRARLLSGELRDRGNMPYETYPGQTANWQKMIANSEEIQKLQAQLDSTSAELKRLLDAVDAKNKHNAERIQQLGLQTMRSIKEIN